ncbi:response regulator [Micromonospora sp. NPDC049366]|uniref:response regulator n=1 Tax=Micromonospora sp. NPDC049366 TaxID=3364271 RepID=UPI0037A68ED9
MTYRCLLVDDNERFLRSARRLLEREGATVVATVTSGADAIATAGGAEIDVSLVDVKLGGESGATVADDLARRGLGGRILLVSTLGEEEVLDLVTRSAAVGFVPKSALSVAAIDAALAQAA